MMKPLFWTLGALVALLCVAGCARPAEKVAEKTIVALLPGYIGPAESYKVRVKSDSLGAMMRGRVRTVHIDGSEGKH